MHNCHSLTIKDWRPRSRISDPLFKKPGRAAPGPFGRLMLTDTLLDADATGSAAHAHRPRDIAPPPRRAIRQPS